MFNMDHEIAGAYTQNTSVFHPLVKPVKPIYHIYHLPPFCGDLPAVQTCSRHGFLHESDCFTRLIYTDCIALSRAFLKVYVRAFALAAIQIK